ncbi:hypothetical protein RhiirA4_489028 [Rhizophagus irregularis]|uniref:Uncharacterized protein n=1 Tax=Rhizophagus irregularis TaxID=588596 RepID=A0A2I1HUF2_9GLOM|nr:hypothetical protein RhiirA4_489028 [Rhizophagus irregularis]
MLVNNGKLIIADFGLSKNGRRPFSGYPRNLLNDHIKDSNKEKSIEGTYTSKVLSEADKIAARLAAARSIKSSTQRNVGMTNQNQDRY